MEEKKVYIYALCDLTGVRYVGKAFNPYSRFNDHINGSYDERNINVYNSPKCRWIRKRKDEIVLCILEEVTENNWKEKEVYWIAYWRPKVNLLNLTFGGDGPDSISKYTKDKLSKAAKGRTHTETTKLKISIANKGNTACLDKICSEETKLKISKSQKGKPKSDICKNNMKGKVGKNSGKRNSELARLKRESFCLQVNNTILQMKELNLIIDNSTITEYCNENNIIINTNKLKNLSKLGLINY